VSDSNPELPPLDANVEALLRTERERPSVSADQAERMWSAISIELGATALPGAAAASPVAGGTSTAQSGLLSAIGKLALLKAIPLVAVSVAVGSVGGFVAGHRIAGPRANQVGAHLNQREPAPGVGQGPGSDLVPIPASMAALPASPVEPPRPPSPVPNVLPSAPPSSHGKRKPASRSDDDLAGEEALLRHAESALRAGSWTTALVEIDAYARRYPKGELAEEAAYLGVRACERGGDAAGTRARLLDFRRRFPSSPLGRSAGD
jgi:hypothetical protein